jgi:hypothetical protein
MKCWVSAFNEQGSRVIIVVAYVAAVKALMKEGMKLNLPPKLVEKLVWVQVISFCKISFPITRLMAYYAETGESRHLIPWLYG